MNINKKIFLVLLFLFSLNNQAKGMFIIENLIKSLYSPNSLLIRSARSNFSIGIRDAIEKGADINTQNNRLRTALHLVIWHRNIEAFYFLIENGIDIRIREEEGHTPLHVAASVNSPRATMILIRESGEDPDYINEENNSGNTPLHLSALENSHHAAKILIQAGAKINQKNSYKKTPLHFAVIKENIEMIKLLIMSGARTNIKDKNRRTAISYATEEIKTFIANLKNKLLRQREKEALETRIKRLEIANLEKERLLHERQEEKRIHTKNITNVQSQLKRRIQQKRFNQKRTTITNIQKQLRKYLAQNNYRPLIHMSKMENDPEYKIIKFRKNFLSMFDDFLQNINGQINKLPTKEELIAEFKQILFMQGISIPSISTQSISTPETYEEEISFKNLVRNFRDADGNTALHLFAMYGKHKFIPVLILNGINIDVQNNRKETPLHLAIELNNIKTSQTLLLLGADPNSQCSHLVKNPRTGCYIESQTPLTIAVELGRKEIFFTLLSLENINLDAQTKPFNQTALHFAVITQNNFFIKELLKAGANTELTTTSSSKFREGATAQDIALSKIEHSPELYACFDSEFAERRREKSNSSLIINLDMYRNIDTEIEEEINSFINWIQENNDVDFSLIIDENKNNIFHYMAKYNHPQLIRLINLFLELGVNINARNKRGFTPLNIALFYGNIEMAQAFVNFETKII